jgi:hypothetical protein
VALLPDLSGTVIEANAVLFDGQGMFIRTKGARNSNDLGATPGLSWGGMLTCLTAGGGIGADCNGYPANAFRYDTPTWGGFSVSTSYGEDDMWDVAVKYAADWNSVKFSAAAGYTQVTDEGCLGVGTCTNLALLGGGGTPHQNFRRDTDLFQIGASVMHVPSGLFVYGLYQNEQNNGTQWKSINFNTGKLVDSNANETDVWYVKAGIKRAWSPVGATVLFGEWGQYNDMFTGLCSIPAAPGVSGGSFSAGTICATSLPIGTLKNGDADLASALVTGSEVDRWGLGIVQEIDSAAMHLFARWQHLDLDIDAKDNRLLVLDGSGAPVANKHFGKALNTDFESLDLFQIGGVIFF